PVTPPKAQDSPPTPVPVPASAPARQERAVRISSDILTRLISFVGETVVQARALEPYCKSLETSISLHRELVDLLQHMQTLRDIHDLPTPVEEVLSRLYQVGTTCAEEQLERINELTVYAQRLSDVSERLYTEALSSRMRPFGDATTGFPRMVRDLARQLDKKVRFEIFGKDTGVDRDIIDRLEAPLTHLLRNAVDHGLESPPERVSRGKPPEALLKLEAHHQAGRLLISISDDGRGIDAEHIRQKVIDKQMIQEEVALKLTEIELYEFLFLPGFSTAKNVTEISGRGVGMDAVQDVMQELGGTVRTESAPGKGTRFMLELPVTRSVIRALLVLIAGEPYAFPLGRTDYLLSITPDEVQTIEGRQFFLHEGRSIGLIEARQVLELPGEAAAADEWPVVVISDHHAEYGLKVDAFCGEREFVVKPLDPRLGAIPDISAVSIMEDGSPVFILAVDDLVRSTDNLLSGRKLKNIGGAHGIPGANIGPRSILVADDSITVRETERRLLESYGYQVDVAVDGMDAWNQLQVDDYDLLVSDIDMPRMNGIELVEKIRAETAIQTLPIMLVSYKDREEDRLRGMEAGANYYFTKSGFHNDAFLEAVVDLIGEARA
ncbi:MAG: hybrid sensor histidine kinase/response regulator, partial [Spartobacteria bacterium]|nr:hybrid sensor histidine kinase/response regulator [Spartobacteria bacterium]